MFTRRMTIFQLFGFDIKVDASWIFLAVLVVWSLAVGWFPQQHPDLAPFTYWAMGIIGAIGLFASIILHELGHSIVARHYGIPIRDITLFIFGGVASMEDEPPSAKSEFFMAIAGPLVSMVLCVIFLGLHVLPIFDPIPALEVLGWLGIVNGMLALFNLIPAFPLDGGRVFRALLWAYKNNLRWATRIAATFGALFGFFLIFLGILEILGGAIISGVWSLMLGLFMRTASQMSYRQVLFRNALEGERVRRFMKTDPVSVPRYISIQDLVEEYIYKYHYKMYPVVEHDRLIGCVSVSDVRHVPREDWPNTPVGEILTACSANNSISPDDDAMQALMSMNRTGNSRMLVLEGDRLVGIIALKDLLKFLSLKLELEDDAS